jgi:hypothetical protein
VCVCVCGREREREREYKGKKKVDHWLELFLWSNQVYVLFEDIDTRDANHPLIHAWRALDAGNAYFIKFTCGFSCLDSTFTLRKISSD